MRKERCRRGMRKAFCFLKSVKVGKTHKVLSDFWHKKREPKRLPLRIE